MSDVCGAATSGGYHNGLYVPAATTSSQQAVTITTSVLDTVPTAGVQGTTSVPNTVPTAGVQGNSGAGQWDHNYGASSAMFQPTPDKRKISRQLPALPSPPVDRRDPSGKIPNPSFAGEQLSLPPPVDRSTSSDTNGSRRSSQRRNVSSKRSPDQSPRNRQGKVPSNQGQGQHGSKGGQRPQTRNGSGNNRSKSPRSHPFVTTGGSLSNFESTALRQMVRIYRSVDFKCWSPVSQRQKEDEVKHLYCKSLEGDRRGVYLIWKVWDLSLIHI